MSSSNNKPKAQKTIFKDAMVLFLITLVAGFALGIVYEITQPVIEQRALEHKKEAYQAVFTEAEVFANDKELDSKAETAAEDLFGPKGLDNITLNEVLLAQDSSGNTLGHVVSISTEEGFGGTITISLGYSLDGIVQGLEFLVLNETVGYGQNAANPEFIEQFIGKQTTEFVSTKSGVSSENEIDALSGATITTNAVTDVINAGLLFLNEEALVSD